MLLRGLSWTFQEQKAIPGSVGCAGSTAEPQGPAPRTVPAATRAPGRLPAPAGDVHERSPVRQATRTLDFISALTNTPNAITPRTLLPLSLLGRDIPSAGNRNPPGAPARGAEGRWWPWCPYHPRPPWVAPARGNHHVRGRRQTATRGDSRGHCAGTRAGLGSCRLLRSPVPPSVRLQTPGFYGKTHQVSLGRNPPGPSQQQGPR